MDDTLPLYPGTDNATIQKMDDVSPSAPAPSSLLTKATLLLGPENSVTTCPFCQALVRTDIKHTTTTRTHTLSLMYCLICCCCCIPFCCDSAKNTDHYCPSCKKYLGTYEK